MRLIGISGKARSGKDSIADYLVGNCGAFRYAFADPLKQAAATAFGIPLGDFYDADKKEVINKFWNISPREIAQIFGTECMRNQFRQDFWVMRATSEMTSFDAHNDKDRIFVIPDVRFENEADWVRKNGGEMWHVIRPSLGEGVVRAHASEAGVEVGDEDIAFLNDADLNNLYALVEARLSDLDAGFR